MSLVARFRFPGPIVSQLPIVIVGIDQASFNELNLPWPWPRTMHSAMASTWPHALQDLTMDMQHPLLLSDSTAAELSDTIPLKPLRRLQVAGRQAPVLVFTVEGLFDDTTSPHPSHLSV